MDSIQEDYARLVILKGMTDRDAWWDLEGKLHGVIPDFIKDRARTELDFIRRSLCPYPNCGGNLIPDDSGIPICLQCGRSPVRLEPITMSRRGGR